MTEETIVPNPMSPKAFQTFVVDDEPLARKEMRFLLKPHPNFIVKWEAETLHQAQEILKRYTPDVVFLDIELRGGSGFDLVPYISQKTEIIFVTSFDDYAVRAFEVNALDYLTKPVSAERLAASLTRLGNKTEPFIPQSESQIGFKQDDQVLLTTQNSRIFVNCGDIHAVVSFGGNYTTIRMANGDDHLVRTTVKHWEQTLPQKLFLRIHRNAIVNVTQINALTKVDQRKFTVTLKGNRAQYVVSRNLVPFVKNILNPKAK